MKQLLSYLQVACIDYAMIILGNSIFNLIGGYQSTDLWNVEIFGFTVVLIMVWNLIGRINFKHSWSFYLVESLGCCGILLVAGYFLNWFHWDVTTIIGMVIRCIIIEIVIIVILNSRDKAEANMINELLQGRE